MHNYIMYIQLLHYYGIMRFNWSCKVYSLAMAVSFFLTVKMIKFGPI